jgi:hypothetical protein
MNIYKIAQEVPQGYVVVKTTINLKTGKKREEFVRGSASHCPLSGTPEDKAVSKFLKQLAEMPVPGFGKDKVVDEGKTSEHYEQHRPATEILPPEEAKPEEEGWVTPPSAPVKPIEQGYGV